MAGHCDEEWVLPWGPRGAREVDGDHLVTSQGRACGSGEGESRAAGSSVSRTLPWEARLEKVLLRRLPCRAGPASPRWPSLAPHCRFLEALAQAIPAEPTGPRGTGRRPLQEFLFREKQPSRCVLAGPLASGAGGGGGPSRGASCLELRRRWTAAVPGAPWCRDSPEKGQRG